MELKLKNEKLQLVEEEYAKYKETILSSQANLGKSKSDSKTNDIELNLNLGASKVVLLEKSKVK